MKYKYLAILLLIPFFSVAQNSKENGEHFLQEFFEEKYTDAVGYFDESVRSKITPELLEGTGEKIKQQLGKRIKTLNQHVAEEQGYQVWYYYTAFEKASLDIKLIFNDKNNIVGFFFVPHKYHSDKDTTLKAYLNYNIQSDGLALPGTLLIADSADQKKLVLFLHGSGPMDRDETVGQIKPFKDLAEGLLHYGISSYRFDKRTKVAPQLFSKNYTVDDEVTNDALNIIRYFNLNDSFKSYKIYIIGHSLGAMMIPRIITKVKQGIAGAVMMAAPARPFEKILMEQLTYLDSLHPNRQRDSTIKVIRQRILYLNSTAFNLNSPNDSLPLGLGASYWQSLEDYQPLKLMSIIHRPVLIMQGEKDYQVSMKDFQLWKRATNGNTKISFMHYRGLSHAFMESKGVPSPKDYDKIQHIPASVISDIANWITNHPA